MISFSGACRLPVELEERSIVVRSQRESIRLYLLSNLYFNFSLYSEPMFLFVINCYIDLYPHVSIWNYYPHL